MRTTTMLRWMTAGTLATLFACSGTGQSSTGGASASVSIEAPRTMIVLYRDPLDAPDAPTAGLPRSAVIALAHRPLKEELQASRPRDVHSFKLLNAFRTSLSADEVARIAQRPEVLAVVPDATLRMHGRPPLPKRATAASPSGGDGSESPLCNTLEPEALELTHAADLDPTVPQAQTVLDGDGQPVIGTGVTVAILADGLDTTVPGFVHSDGSPVFVDYQDFSGDPAGTPTAGGEMYGDASSIAAQDTPNGSVLSYDISQFATPSAVPSPCNVRVRGMAPGASLVGLKVFSALGYTTTSAFVDAIEWAVLDDHVDIINESFAGNPYPDTSNDPISLVNAAAVRAGVTVTTGTGDAGPAGTMGSPATDPWVIAAGATTQYRIYAQLDMGAYALANGYVDSNIASFSSAGFAELTPRTTDLVAPGDSGWALCSTNPSLYTDCENFNGGATPLLVFGGTSEASPITAGAAALVIQAYRSTHGGRAPYPALVKEILMSSAKDLGAPSNQQGAGLLNALEAVRLALSIDDRCPEGAPRQGELLASPNADALTVVAGGPPDSLEREYQLRNTGTATVTLRPALESLGATPVAQGTATLALPGTYVTGTFVVPTGADHLEADIAFPQTYAGEQTYVELALLDPSGRLVAQSDPQGLGTGYGRVDVVKPNEGAWTAVVFGPLDGSVELTWTAEAFRSVGSVVPASITLAPGETTTVVTAMTPPEQPGDLAAALRFHDVTGLDSVPEIPVTVRTLVPLSPRGGSFSGTLTGGNGRPDASPTQTYEFEVPSGVHDLGLSLTLGAPGYAVTGYLIDPEGLVLASDSNLDPTGNLQTSLQLFRDAPSAGLWRFVLEETQASGSATSVGFQSAIHFNQASVSAPTLPTSRHAKVSASAPLEVPISFTNTGSLAKAFFADARLSGLLSVALPVASCGVSATSPGLCEGTTVPPEAVSVEFVATAALPISMDATFYTGGTDLWAVPSSSGSLVASLQSPEVSFGPWYAFPTVTGPFGASGAPTTDISTSVVVTMAPIDAAVSSTSGDYWADALNGTSTFAPLILAPGGTGTITVTFAPDEAEVGHSVSGVLHIDAVNSADPFATGDEVTSLAYAYTVAP